MRRRPIAVMAALLIGSALSVSPGLTTAAQASWEQCQSGRLCGWHQNAYRGEYNRYTNNFNDLQSNSDEWNSIRNRSKVAWLVFEDEGYKGTVRCIRPGKGSRNLKSVDLKDKISSIKKRTVANCSDYVQIG